jgi:peptide/nickel transport system substrate-binding protein
MKPSRTHLARALAATVTGAVLGLTLAGSVAAQERGKPVPPIVITSVTSGYDQLRFEGARMVTEEWKKLGFDIKVETMDWNRIVDLGMRDHTLAVTFLGWGGRPERLDPYYWLHTMYHSIGARRGGTNIPHYKNPEYDRLADQFAAIGDLNQRRDLAFKLQEIAARDVPFIPFFRRKPHYAYLATELDNVQSMPGTGLQNYWNWVDIRPNGSNRNVRYGWPEDIILLNPLSTLQGNDHALLHMLYDSLFRFSLKGDITPWAATGIKRVNDLTYEVTLRQGMKWHDGQPFTVQDVKFTYDTIKSTKAPYSGWRLEQMERVEIVDDNTLRFVLTEAFAPFVTYALADVFILPKHIWEPKLQELGAKEIMNWNNLPPVGSGAFRFDYWRRGVEAKLNANKDHFHAPKIDAYIHVPYGSVGTLVEGLVAGQINISGWALEPIQIDRVRTSNRLKLATTAELGLRSIHLNLEVEPFDRVEVRRALAAAVPKKRFVDLVMEGYGEAAENVVAPENTFWHNPNTEKLSSNPQLAREILAKAGYTWDSQGKLYYPR